MINGIYLSTMGALVEATQHALVSNNIANANTVGYKPDYANFQALLAESALQPGTRAEVNKLLEETGGGVWLNQTATVFQPGGLIETKNPLNVAIDTENGFFRVSKDGQEYLTRDGSFQLDAQGNLVMADGTSLVLDQGGAPIRLGDVTGEIAIHADGAIQDVAANAIVGALGLVRVNDLGLLKKSGDNLYRAEGAELAPGEVQVTSGWVEGSAVVPVREMVAMIEAARAYQANMKFISIQDDTLARTVSTVGSVR